MSPLFFFALFGFLSVAFGAFGAHGLKAHVSPADLVIFETGVRYMAYHALALGVLGVWQRVQSGLCLKRETLLFVLGICIFSGSLFLLVITNTRWLGAITPIGGTLLLVAWAMVGVRAVRSEK
ncbi:MAG: DUF423 domain-containing protein [Deltaproteobacteria bacterium]|nr:DUF423 domain-containing protein [Deltaproteobacteria bacterium]